MKIVSSASNRFKYFINWQRKLFRYLYQDIFSDKIRADEYIQYKLDKMTRTFTERPIKTTPYATNRVFNIITDRMLVVHYKGVNFQNIITPYRRVLKKKKEKMYIEMLCHSSAKRYTQLASQSIKSMPKIREIYSDLAYGRRCYYPANQLQVHPRRG